MTTSGWVLYFPRLRGIIPAMLGVLTLLMSTRIYRLKPSLSDFSSAKRKSSKKYLFMDPYLLKRNLLKYELSVIIKFYLTATGTHVHYLVKVKVDYLRILGI